MAVGSTGTPALNCLTYVLLKRVSFGRSPRTQVRTRKFTRTSRKTSPSGPRHAPLTGPHPSTPAAAASSADFGKGPVRKTPGCRTAILDNEICLHVVFAYRQLRLVFRTVRLRPSTATVKTSGSAACSRESPAHRLPLCRGTPRLIFAPGRLRDGRTYGPFGGRRACRSSCRRSCSPCR